MDLTALPPVEAALAHLGELAAAGVPPERIIQAVGEIVASWASEADMDADAAQARIERLWDSVGKDAAELEEQINDATGADARALAGAKRTLAALQAAALALATAHERL